MARYFGAPLETDPQVLLLEAFQDIQARRPGWVPHEANLEVLVLAAALFRVADLRDVASVPPDEILRVVGTRLHNIPSIEAAAATADTTWTAIDDAGYTVPAGAEISIAITGSERALFAVTETTEIPVGSTSATVPVEALVEGEDANGLSGTATLQNPRLDWVASIVVIGETSGGVVAETNDDYLARLVARLRLLSPRPILARDFAVLALDTAGVGRATAIDNYIPGTNEVEQIDIDATSGQWTFEPMDAGQVASGLDWDITAEELQAAIEALPNVLPGDVKVTGGPGGTAPLVVEWTGQYGDQNVTTSVTTDTLSGGAGTATVTTVTPGVAPDDAAERAVTVVVTDDDGEALSSVIRGEVDAQLQAYREVNFLVYVRSPVYTEIQVDVDVVPLPGFDPAAVLLGLGEALDNYLSPANWGRTAGDVTTEAFWENRDTVRYLEIASVVNDAIGIDYITTLEIGREGGTLGIADVALPGAAPLPRLGTLNATAS